MVSSFHNRSVIEALATPLAKTPSYYIDMLQIDMLTYRRDIAGIVTVVLQIIMNHVDIDAYSSDGRERDRSVADGLTEIDSHASLHDTSVCASFDGRVGRWT